jgi:hypothetical protein
MKKAVLLPLAIAAIIIILYEFSDAQYISVKRNFWGSLQYTKNGVDFKSFGAGWKDLLAETESVNDAHDQIRQARNDHYISNFLGLGGGIILGFAAFMEYHNEDVNENYWLFGVGLSLTSILCDIMYRHRLDSGLRAYNRQLGGHYSAIPEANKFAFGFTGKGVAVSYYF